MNERVGRKKIEGRLSQRKLGSPMGDANVLSIILDRCEDVMPPPPHHDRFADG